MKVEIKKIVLDIDGKEIPLSVESAEKLFRVLGELFDQKVIINYPAVIYPAPVPRPWYLEKIF